ncbi:MAG: hypothetical protein JKX97_09150, partial [Candidatus Lindowbacteria bacterium]|nr:hypothetical protein [Candidatus Lindowbacteria bacterium]
MTSFDAEHQHLKDRLQAGVNLVDHYLQAHVAEFIAIDESMVAALQHWVTVSASTVAHDTTSNNVVQCGPLRRDPDGSWWWLEHLLGHDDDPSPALTRVESSVRIVTLALGDALEVATEALDQAGDRLGFRTARRALHRYDHW